MRIVYAERGVVPGVGKVWCFRHAVDAALTGVDVVAHPVEADWTCAECEGGLEQSEAIHMLRDLMGRIRAIGVDDTPRIYVTQADADALEWILPEAD